MALGAKSIINPDLESLRLRALSVTCSEDFDKEIEDIVSRTSRIHAGFLFHSPKTLQLLLRVIGEAHSSTIEAGWQSLGDKLGLDLSILRVINNNHFNHEDPVYNTFLHYAQYEDATIGNIVKALREIGRLDVIARTKDAILQLAQVLLNHEQKLIRSSRPTSEYGSSESNDDSNPQYDVLNEVLIKPSAIPDAPFIMKNVQAAPLLSTLLLQGVTSSRTNVICSSTFSEALTTAIAPTLSVVSDSVVDRPSKQKYYRKVMLTFSGDGEDVATEVARVLREERGSARIGVLILGEQIQHMQPDPYSFITASFHMVDYVVPIITADYLRTVLTKARSEATSVDCVDAKFVPFVYQIMVQDYIRRGCLNDKVRCLIPDDSLESILNHLMMAGPLFSAWDRVGRADTLAERILNDSI